MKTPWALVLDDGAAITIGGLTLAERSTIIAHRAGLAVCVWGAGAIDPASDARLQSRGVTVRRLTGPTPLEESRDRGVVVVGPRVLLEPAVIADLASPAVQGASSVRAVYQSGIPLVLSVPASRIADLRTCLSIETMAAALAGPRLLHEAPLTGAFCRRVDRAELAHSSERAYIRHLNGKDESFFTKIIRRFSVPLTSRLVRLGARPTHVTLVGLVLAVVSASFLARGSYWAGVFGGVLGYASMIFDCSDGEVARLTLRDSRFGAWLETMVDYLTYFLVLGALTIATRHLPNAEAHRVAAAIALAGSLAVVIVASYLRYRVAAADPGQFDDASAKAMSATRFHRFARWGRQWIKRSSVTHLILALAIVNQLPALLYLWAFGASAATLVILAVEPFVARRVAVVPAGGHHPDADDYPGVDE